MRVTRLEVFGFKSFMERLVLPLDGGITGVVGPNGCGKSNIVDALRWVLGETRASNLRGELLEDVIFNGTDKLRPLGLAEVSITIRANGENFFEELISNQGQSELSALIDQLPVNWDTESDSSEQSVSEPSDEQFKDGDNNGEEVSDPKIRRKAHLTVIDGSLAARAQDGAVSDEGAQNVSPDAEGAQDDEAKKSQVREHLSNALVSRFTWLRSANEVQITRRLYRSGESEFFINRVPCRLKDIKDLLRAVGLGPRSYTIVAQGEVSRIISARPEERRTIIEEAAGVLGFRDRVAATKRRIEETQTNVSRLTDIISEVTRQVGSLKRQAARAEARAELKSRIIEIDQVLSREKLREVRERLEQKGIAITKAQQECDRLSNEVVVHQATEENARGTLLELDVRGDAIRSKIDNLREQLERRARRLFEKQSKVKEIELSISSKDEEVKRLDERRTQLEQRKEDSTREVATLTAQVEEITQQLNSIERASDTDVRESAALVQAARDKLRSKEQDLRQAREQLIASQSTLAEIEKQIVSLSPMTQLQKTLGSSVSGSKLTSLLSEMGGKVRVLAEALKVGDRYTRAVQAILAEKAVYLLSDKPHHLGKRFVDEVLTSVSQAGLGLGVLKTGVEVSDGAISGFDSPFPTLISEIGCDEDAKGVVNQLLKGIYVVDTIEQAIDFINSNYSSIPSDARFVSLSGEILSRDSFATLRHEGGIIHIRNRAEEIREKVAALEGALAIVQSAKDEAQTELSVAEDRHRTVQRESQERQSRLRQLAAEQGSARGKREAAERLVQQISNDRLRVDDQVRSAEERKSQLGIELERVRTELREVEGEDESGAKSELEALNREYQELDPIRKSSRSALSEAVQRVHAVRNEFERMRNEVSGLSLDRQRYELEVENIRERVLSEYGEAILESVEEGLRDTTSALDLQTKSQLKDELEKIRARIAREGDVDPSSIEQYKEESKRLDELTAQRLDLEESLTALNRTVEQLTRTSQERFLATFEAVRDNFGALVPRLFGGGKGSLELSDPHHPLESGVEIVARPPGKKLKSIELMSGGEKALCATALIFSMFLVRPSPLCVLDEVDAPLDEANVVRLVTMIQEMGKHTQFIMITHNKASMSAANNLVGVTMQEPGASRVISVSLQEAVRQVG